MNFTIAALSVVALSTSLMVATARAAAPSSVPWKFRPPAVPLVTHSPYFSIWSMSDRLTDDTTKHWTGAKHALTATVTIDGKRHRILGSGDDPALEQTSLVVLPTRTIARFEGAGIRMDVTFMSPLLPDQVKVLARPITYVAFEVLSTDKQT